MTIVYTDIDTLIAGLYTLSYALVCIYQADLYLSHALAVYDQYASW